MPLTDHAWSTPADPSHSSRQQSPPPRVVTKRKRTKGRKKNMADLAASLANRTAPKHKRYTPDMARNRWTKSGGASENGLWPGEGKSQRTTDMTTSLGPCVCTDGEAQGWAQMERSSPSVKTGLPSALVNTAGKGEGRTNIHYHV